MSDDLQFIHEAYLLAKKGFDEGGLPIGAVLVKDGAILGRGHNQRVQQNDPTAHGEIDCIRNAGRQQNYKSTTLYTTLTPCLMCSGAIIHLGIPRVVIGDNQNFDGNEDFLRSNGVRVDLLEYQPCVELMAKFKDDHQKLVLEDFGQR